MQKFGVTAEQAAGGGPDAAWLLAEGGGEAHPYLAGDRLPIGIEAFPGREHARMAAKGVTREQVVAGLRPLLELPVEVVLVAHGEPTDRAALDRALTADH